MVKDFDKDVVRFAIDALVGLVAFAGAFWLNDLNNRINGLAKEISERNQRLSVVETHIELVNRRLDRIEGKLDLLIENRAGARP